MNSFLKKAGIAVTLGATVLVSAAPAEAQRYRRYDRDRNDAGIAIAAGIAGLAVGAAIASSNDRRYRGRYYDRGYRGYRGYYRDRGYDYDRRYYRNRGYYPRDGYYAYRDRGYNRCATRRVWDPYLDRPVRVRYC